MRYVVARTVRLVSILVLSGSLGLSGCEKPRSFSPPVTYPAAGILIIPGEKVIEGTLVRFISEAPELRTQGVVDADGNFSLFVISHSERFEGATAGPHRVAVVFPLNADRSAGREFLLDEEFVVEPRPNKFTITLPPHP